MAPPLGKNNNEDSNMNKIRAREILKNREESVRKRLVECMEAPKLKKTLMNGYIDDNRDLLEKLKEEQGRKRNMRYYFEKQPKGFGS